jgi:hypothetical protein
MAIYPKYVNGEWVVCYESMNGQASMIPFADSQLIASV